METGKYYKSISSPPCSEPVVKHLPTLHWAQLMLIVEIDEVLVLFQVFLHMPSHLVITTLKGGNNKQM